MQARDAMPRTTAVTDFEEMPTRRELADDPWATSASGWGTSFERTRVLVSGVECALGAAGPRTRFRPRQITIATISGFSGGACATGCAQGFVTV